MRRRWASLERWSALRRNEDGQELVEFLLVAPLFFLLLLGMVDFGLIFGGYVTMRGGVEAGARMASVDNYGTVAPCSPSDPTSEMVCTVIARIGSLPGMTKQSLQIGISFTSGTIAGDPVADAVAGDNVTVCASAQLHSTTGLTAPFIDGRTASTSSTIRLEQNPQFGSFTSGSVTFGGQTVKGMTCPP